MLEIQSPQHRGRRAVLKAGVLSIAGLNLATQKRLIADGTAKKNNKSVILIWLDGGPSQLESASQLQDKGRSDSLFQSCCGS